MTKQDLEILSESIENIAKYFEDKPFTQNIRLLRGDFDINKLGSPNQYLKIIDDLEELQRESRHLFNCSVLNKVCREENKIYIFEYPFKSSMNYDGVMKKDGTFYLRDEDSDLREIFTSKEFSEFLDDLYWELYNEN